MVDKSIKKLTERETRFVEAYLVVPNGMEAAIKAGYSPRSAKQIADQLLKRPHIAQALADARAARSERTQITADWVLKRLHGEAMADLKSIYDDAGRLRPISEWPEVWRTGLVVGVESFEEYSGQGKDREAVGMVRKVRISDRIKHVELIGKHVDVRAFREQLGLSDKDGNPLQVIVQKFTPEAPK